MQTHIFIFSQIASLQICVLSIMYQLAFVTGNYLHASHITLTLVSFYSIWSLDLGRILTPNVCVGHSIETVDSIALQYMSAFYGLGLVFITYCIVELHRYNFLFDSLVVVELVWVIFGRFALLIVVKK